LSGDWEETGVRQERRSEALTTVLALHGLRRRPRNDVQPDTRDNLLPSGAPFRNFHPIIRRLTSFCRFRARGRTMEIQVMVMNGSIRIGQVRGIPLRTHWSVPLLVVLFAYGLGSRTLPSYVPGLASGVYTLGALAGALLLVVSLVVHEAAHALTGRRAGIPVQDMTLWALGGMTRMDRPKTARAAFVVAVSGPLASLAVGGAALAAGVGTYALFGRSVPAGVLLWLGGANLLLGVFNLLPAAPLDGGRVLQAAVWWRTGDQNRALRAAGRSGQVFGWLLVAVGVLSFAGGAPGGLWLALIGGFVAIVASAERKRAVLGAALRGVRVAEAMSGPVTTGPDWLTVDRFIDEVAAQAGHSVLPLLDLEGRPSGVVQLRRLAAVPPARRPAVRARDVATPVSRCTVAVPEEAMEDVLDRIGSTAGTGLPVLVMDAGHLAGIITAHDITRLVRRHTLGPAPG
jgi:Zn-dependent protease